jgi:hypothetical protein
MNQCFFCKNSSYDYHIKYLENDKIMYVCLKCVWIQNIPIKCNICNKNIVQYHVHGISICNECARKIIL